MDIDFVGSIDGEVFEGGSAKGSKLILGSNTMIPGFEEGLLGTKSGEDKQLKLKFPKDYHKQDFADKTCVFKVHVNAVAAVHLSELNEDFFKSFDVTEGGEEAFRDEVKKNMTRELTNAVKNNVKTQVLEGLVAGTEVILPKAMVENEINNLRQQAVQRYGGNKKIDASLLPAEMFKAQAEQRVSIGLILNEIIQQNELKANPGKMREIIEELAAGYENPVEVIAWYYNEKEQMSQIESMALEESVIDLILEKAQVVAKNTSYEEALKPIEKAQQKTAKKAEKPAPKEKSKSKKKIEPETKTAKPETE